MTRRYPGRTAPAFALLRWREAMDFSAVDACAMLGCSRQALRNWETGATKVPRYILLACAALAKGLKPI